MGKLRNCEFIMDIEWIDDITGENQYFEILFTTKDNKRYKFLFDGVCGLRYSIANGYPYEFNQARTQLPKDDDTVNSSTYLVEDSDYVKSFEKQAVGKCPIGEIKDYIITDMGRSGTVVEVLTTSKPVLVRM
ncbi:MAG: hypothetical protein LBJ48_03025 [Coriobacteriales bacterium]|jgi:hypothetical protein|nr:hypothetical protein [Coriobacteriales bacterium]